MDTEYNHRDKPEIELLKKISASDLALLLTLLRSQELACLYNGRETKVICMVDTSEVEDRLMLYKTNSEKLTEVDEKTFHSIWSELLKLKETTDTQVDEKNTVSSRVLLVYDTMIKPMKKEEVRDLHSVLRKFYQEMLIIVEKYGGELLNSGTERFGITFQSSKKAILCSYKLSEQFYGLLDRKLHRKVVFRMGLGEGEKMLFGNRIGGTYVKRTERLCLVSRGKIMVSSDFMEITGLEYPQVRFDEDRIDVLNSDDERFVSMIFDCLEKKW
ncbi:MAG: hypothetical protein ACK5M7_13440 [Draconibacterium sp.]